MNERIVAGAERLDAYLSIIRNKRVGILTNQTGRVGNKHLVQVLTAHDICITKIFCPEHGFSGLTDDGVAVHDDVDEKYKIPIISLFGRKKEPDEEDLRDVDILLYDVQDVGVRFYTYLSTLQLFIEAAATSGKSLIILDRPNPNGFYVDGPVLDPKFKSFAGMQPVPIVYGMTIGEYAKMLIGEGWLNYPGSRYNITIVPCLNYNHEKLYSLPVFPSPNLPNMTAVYLYPSLCLFEGTVCSEGRGTLFPFQVFGHPSFPDNLFNFTPQDTVGASNAKYKSINCFGYLLARNEEEALNKINKRIQLKWLMKAYHMYGNNDAFFRESWYFNFDELAGTDKLRLAVQAGWAESEIRESWEPQLKIFRDIRAKYLIYEDFNSN